MKKMILTAAVIAAAAMMTVSCNKDTENTGLSVDAEAINYPLSGGTYDINLTSGKPWKALYCAEWLTVTPESGTGDATITVGTDIWANEENREARLASVYFTDDADTVSVLIGQSNDNNSAVPGTGIVTSNTNYLHLSKFQILGVPREGSTYVIELDTGSDWWIENDHNWISISPTSGRSGWNSIWINVRAWVYPELLALKMGHHDSYADSEDTRTATFYVGYESQPGVVSRRPVKVTQRGR